MAASGSGREKGMNENDMKNMIMEMKQKNEMMMMSQVSFTFSQENNKMNHRKRKFDLMTDTAQHAVQKDGTRNAQETMQTPHQMNI
ncbi:hypothetical protein VNO78_02753 [Psophocarpus tetragonolobus]|uniref:Uncharacterized protein n=1 Tax=Psophocarpus tetragonolobus TaxID=3891 RepID=A0AAN9TCM9_PSOTE